MAVVLNHTIVPSRDKKAGAAFLAEVLGLPEPVPFGNFFAVDVDNGVTLDWADADAFRSQHFAFLVSEEEFDAIYERVTGRGVPTFADPGHRRSGINHSWGGRGFYFPDPDGHNMEVLTQPYSR